MKAGDFTELASLYHNRPGYSRGLLGMLGAYARNFHREDIQIADVGAGTGKLTEDLVSLGYRCLAVEPNDAMRAEGVRALDGSGVVWRKGSAEATGLESSSVHWVTMGSSFHWADTELALSEFARILKPKGLFTAIWNPRDIEQSDFHLKIENMIREIVPELKRVSSGTSEFTTDLDRKLTQSGKFKECIFSEARYTLDVPKATYLGAWDSVNDIQVQAGPERWRQIQVMLREQTRSAEIIKVPYRSRAWTVQRS